jgi:hypothetical protein
MGWFQSGMGRPIWSEYEDETAAKEQISRDLYLNHQKSNWCVSCNIRCFWCVSNDEPRRVSSEGEGACSRHFRVRSHLSLRGKQGWMTPRVGVKTTLTNGNAPIRALVPKQEPHFLASLVLMRARLSALSRRTLRQAIGPSELLIDFSCDRDIQLMQDVRHLGVPQSRGVVLERQMILVIDPEAPQTIGVGERS